MLNCGVGSAFRKCGVWSGECGVAAERWNNGYKKRAKKWLEKRKKETFFINKKNIFCIVFTA